MAETFDKEDPMCQAHEDCMNELDEILRTIECYKQRIEHNRRLEELATRIEGLDVSTSGGQVGRLGLMTEWFYI